MGRNHARTPAGLRVLRESPSLAAAPAVCVAGVVLDLVWVLGLGAWLLIAAILMELVYRP
ncbi:hypothetical protein AB0A05_35010 [Streptomyces sp. NPDC046374]|uniref:hypothetical protein n=1 Tax=Streptomyces sp. NPDC046374 TaxID=3154917 RepID=UPI0033EB8FAB